jgi:hypothetical protein
MTLSEIIKSSFKSKEDFQKIESFLKSFNSLRRLGPFMISELAREVEIGYFGDGELICDAFLNPPFIMVPLDVS